MNIIFINNMNMKQSILVVQGFISNQYIFVTMWVCRIRWNFHYFDNEWISMNESMMKGQEIYIESIIEFIIELLFWLKNNNDEIYYYYNYYS